MIKVKNKLVIFLLILVFFDLLILSFINRKALCIQSNWVAEVVWHFSETESVNIYTCDDKLKTLYREEIADQVQLLNEHIIKVEKKLKGLGALVHGFRVHIDSRANNSMQVYGNDLTLSANLISEEGGEALERGLVKSWVLQQQKAPGLDLFKTEALTHLFLGISDLHPKAKSEWLDWLQSSIFHVSTNSAWCASPLKQVEYESLCLSFEKQSVSGGFATVPSALWFSKKVVEVYNQLSIEKRLLFLKNFHILVENLSLLEGENKGFISLSDLVIYLRREMMVWSDIFKTIKLPEVSEHLLKSFQLEEDHLNSYWSNLDFIFYQEEDWTPLQIQRFEELSLTERDYKIIGLNAKGFWMWPFVGPIQESSLDFNIKAKYVVYKSCEAPLVKNLLMKWSDRILWVQNCNNKEKPIIFNGFLHRGLQYFSLDNADTKFISFYLPALNYLISKNPAVIEGVFALKAMKDQKSNLGAMANWNSALWNSEYRAFEVSAAISAVDWFKLPDGIWPEIMTK